MEFRALNERRTANTRTILKATLPALGIVDAPAYPASEVGLRAVKGRGIAGSIPYGNRPRTIADRGRRRKRSYGRGAFSYNLERWTGLQADLAAAIQDAVADEVAKAREAVAQTPDVLLLRGRRTNGAVASMKAGVGCLPGHPGRADVRGAGTWAKPRKGGGSWRTWRPGRSTWAPNPSTRCRRRTWCRTR